MITGVTTEFMGGWIEAVSSLASQAYGSRNHNLVGRYTQVAVLAYVVCQLPMVL